VARLDIDQVAILVGGTPSGDVFFQLGMMYACGREVEQDRVAAHKYFNLAAVNGVDEAVTYRQELAAEMDGEEVREALRQAREYLSVH